MGDFNLGSFTDEIFNFVDNITTTMSGIPLMNLVERQITFVENWTGDTIGSTAVVIKYQGPVLHLSMADTLDALAIQGADVGKIRIGDFTQEKTGGDSSTSDTSTKWREMGMKELKELGKKVRFTKVLG